MTSAPTPATDAPKGVDVARVTAWFQDHAPEVVPPLGFELIAGGRSNLTYRVTDTAGHAWVLRRPPLGQVLATAHDMGREHRIISALAPTDVPVRPGRRPVRRRGGERRPVLRDGLRRRAWWPATRRRRRRSTRAPGPDAGDQIADVLARIHAVDPDAVGLGDLGRREGYVERQLKRWYGQWQKSKTRDLPVVDEVHDALAARIPEQGPAAIVHGDYRLDNCLLAPTARSPRCSTGSCAPSATRWPTSACCSCTGPSPAIPIRPCSRRPPRSRGSPTGPPWSSGTRPPRAATSPRVDYYVAFGYWKLACILEGVYARYKGGVMGETSGFEGFARQVEILADAARATVESLPPA